MRYRITVAGTPLSASQGMKAVQTNLEAHASEFLELKRRQEELSRQEEKLRERLAEAVATVQPCVADFCRWPERIRDIWKDVLRAAADKQLSDIDEKGKELQNLIDALIANFSQYRDRVVRELEALGAPIPNSAQFDQTIEDLKAIRVRLAQHWPWLPTSDKVEEARAEYVRGEFRTAEEILNELRGANGLPQSDAADA